MSYSLEEIKDFLKEELDRFEGFFKESMKSNVGLLDKITHYIVKSKGKQVRPIFVFLSARMHGEVTESTHVGASLIELLHTATLVHDDVVDDSSQRRGFFSINALWKNKIAVLVGDYLLSKGLLLAVENKKYKQLEILSKAVRSMAEGELLQIEKARRLDITETVYYDIIRKKTASLISAANGVGAASVSDDEDLIARMEELGEVIGICFQIKDDLFDYGRDDVGKPLGIDIKEKKMTLPLIYALQQCTKGERRHIIRLVKGNNNDAERVREVLDFVQRYEGLAYAEKQMYAHRQKAFDLLATFPDSQAKDYYSALITYITERKK